jgi:hypothetical protein
MAKQLKVERIFQTVESLFDAITTENPFSNERPYLASRAKGNEWYGTDSFRAAETFATAGGWSGAGESAGDAIAGVMSKLRETIKPEATRVYAAAGAFPHVALAAAGNPVHMIRPVPTPGTGKGRTVRVLVNCAASAGISQQTMIARGVAYVALVEALQSLGYSVELWVGFSNETGKARLGVAWKIKTAGGQIDRDRLIFNLANPSNYRRLGLAVMESLSNEEREALHCAGGGNYGTPTPFTESFMNQIAADVVADAPIRLGERAERDPVGFVIETLTGLNII